MAPVLWFIIATFALMFIGAGLWLARYARRRTLHLYGRWTCPNCGNQFTSRSIDHLYALSVAHEKECER